MTNEESTNAVREAFEAGRYEATRHFWQELRADGFWLADVHSALDDVAAVVRMGEDEAGNPKYEITGFAADGRALSLVCAVKNTGVVLFITVYVGTKP